MRYDKGRYDTLPAESKMAVSLCPVVSERTETERRLRISPHHPLLPPGHCNYPAGYGAVQKRAKYIKHEFVFLFKSKPYAQTEKKCRRTE